MATKISQSLVIPKRVPPPLMHGHLELTVPQTFDLSFRFERDQQDVIFPENTSTCKESRATHVKPRKESRERDVILCTSDPIHINFLQSWMAIGQEPPPFRICINLMSNFFGAAPLAEKVDFLWREPPLVIRGDQFSNWSVASPSSFSFHWMLFPALSIPVQWRSGCGSHELEQCS